MKRESCLERELRHNRHPPPKQPQPSKSRRNDGYGSESKEKETGPEEVKLKLPEFSRSWDSMGK
jgi:hypothetical protein